MPMPSKPSGDARAAFGKWLQEKRNTLGYTQEEAARRAGIVRQQWIRIEAGKSGTRPETIPGIASALSLPEDEVFTRAGYAVPGHQPSELTRRLETILNKLPTAERQKVETLLERHAQDYATILEPYLHYGVTDAQDQEAE